MLTTFKRFGTAVTGWLKAICKHFASRATPGRRLRKGEVEIRIRARLDRKAGRIADAGYEIIYEDLSAKTADDAATFACAISLDAMSYAASAVIKRLEADTGTRVYRTFIASVNRQYFDSHPVTEPDLKQLDTQGGVIP